MLAIKVREAVEEDAPMVVQLMEDSLSPYYGGDHRAHARRILATHLSGGRDQIGHFSFEQKIFIADLDGVAIGMINVVGKRQDTYKISPLIVAPEYRSGYGVGSSLLAFAENYAQSHGARQMYCTVAESNDSAFSFFVRKGYVVAGRSESHYKEGVVETMMYKLFVDPKTSEQLDASNISVVPLQDYHKPQATELMLSVLPQSFRGVDANWVQALYDGYDRRNSEDINTKFELIYVAVDRDSNVLGIAGATPKKGQPIKLMPLVATSPQSFVALLRDLPFVLKTHGHKIYIHIVPDVDQTISLQRLGWKLDAAMPAA